MSSKLLVVIGCLEDEDHIKRVVKNVETGIEKWMKQLPLDDQEEMIQILSNIPSMKSIPNRNADVGTVVSRYKGRILDSTVLISPTSENLQEELYDLFLAACPRCLVAYGGFVTDDNADWVLQDGLFSFTNFWQIFKDSKVVGALSEHGTKVTISCCKLGLWKNTEGVFDPDSKITLEIMDSQPIAEQNGAGDHSCGTQSKKQSNIEEFSSFLEEGIGNEIGGIFSTLKPPLQEGFLKIRNPCLYIFPGGNGDSAFFAVNGFNMLVNGGACSKPWFWKLIQHVDRVDSILATHIGSDNLPGINSLLLRKLQERQVKLPMDNTTPEYQEMRRCLISPDLGPLFINAPAKFLESIAKSGSTSEAHKSNGKMNGASPNDDSEPKQPVQKTVDVAKDTLRLSKALNMEMVPLVRKAGSSEPMTLFSKVGLGRLEMYVISPSEGSKELAYVNEKWGCNGKTGTPTGKTGILDSAGHEGDSSVTNLSSICALLVWHPSNPHEKVVRVLFPGNASQAKIFEGLESLKNLPFLKTQYVTKNVLNKQKHSAKPNGTHTTQKATRPMNAANLGKKPAAATAPRKAAPASNAAPTKKETAASAKVTEKRTKAERPATMKTKPTSALSTAKNAPVREKAGASRPAKTALEKSSTKTAASLQKKPASSRPTSSNTQSKTDTKRPATATSRAASATSKAATATSKAATATSKVTTARKTQPATSKATEKPRKPQTLTTTSKQKTTPKKATKKVASPTKALSDKGMPKKEKAATPVKATVPTTPPEDLTADFKQLSPEKMSKPTDLPSTGSEEPTSSVLSDRHSPEGEDGSTIQYAESPSTQNDKVELVKDDSQPQHPQEHEDVDFVIMNKPEISEDSDMISTNGSSAVAQPPTPQDDMLLSDQAQKQVDELISSDKSTPDETQDEHKSIKFNEPEEEQAHKPVERKQTPFHSLQDSSATSETSPISESYNASPAVVAPAPSQEEIKMEISEENDKQIETIPQGETIEQAEQKDEVPEPSHEFVPAENTDERNVTEPPKEFGSEVHSSFNSSVEGSYELYPTGRSTPPPASGQETIAETISDFKHDEPPAVGDLEDPSTYMDTHPQQVEMLEDPTMSTDAPDARYSMSTTSTGSQFARMDPPFSSSEIGPPSVAKDPSLASQPEYESRDQEEVMEKDEMPEVDQDVAQEIEEAGTQRSEAEEDAKMVENFQQQQDVELAAGMQEELQDDVEDVDENQNAEENAKVVENLQQQQDVELAAGMQKELQDDVEDVDENQNAEEDAKMVENLLQQRDVELATGMQKELQDDVEDVDENLNADEDAGFAHQDDKPQGLENYPQQVWSAQCEADYQNDEEEVEREQDFDLHAQQHQEDEKQREHFDEHGIMDNAQIPDAKLVIDFGVDALGSGEQMQEEQEEKVQLTGSLASSAQDQGQDDDSEPTSMTETADASEADPPQAAFVDDGPDLKDYEHTESESMPKTDLLLMPTEDHFALHGGSTTEQSDLLAFDEKVEEKEPDSAPDVFEQKNTQPTDLWQDQTDIPSPTQRYHPAYVDQSAPLADTEEVGIDQLKATDLDSPLDANAKPFIPKSSVPLDPSPTYGTEAQFGQGDAFSDQDVFKAAAPTSPPTSNNPFLVDLMSGNQQNPFNTEEPCLPPQRESDPCAAQDKTGKVPAKKTGTSAAKKPTPSPVYVDLVYVPNHGNKNSVGTDFFKKIRAKYYVISGNDQSRDEPSAEVLNHLLEGRRSWFSEPSTSATGHDDTNVTVIPTHDTQTVREWYKENFKELESCNVHMVASGSKVMVQVESIEACKIEF